MYHDRMYSATGTLASEFERPLPFKLGYRPGLDGLRAVAVALVFYHHVLVALFPSAIHMPAGANFSVDIFFVLSGFLITTLLVERRGKQDVGRFYLLRARRLLPAFWTYILAATLYSSFIANPSVSPKVIARSTLTSLVYVFNYVTSQGFAESFTHLWTLSVEGQFYAIWPLFMLGVFKLGVRTQVVVMAVAALVVLIWRAYAISNVKTIGFDQYVRSDFRIDSMLVGACLGLLMSHQLLRQYKKLSRWLGPLSLAAIGFMVYFGGAFSRSNYQGGFTFVAVLSAFVIYSTLSDNPLTRILSTGWLVFLGKISYSLYLWHIMAIYFARQLVGNGFKALCLTLTFTAIMSVLSYFVIEQPAMTRLFQSHTHTSKSTIDLTETRS